MLEEQTFNFDGFEFTMGKTDNYDYLQDNPLNRDQKPAKNLEESMMKNGFRPECHIICTRLRSGRIRIVQGHHRKEKAKKLGLPIIYMVMENLRPLELTEYEDATESYTNLSYFQSYCRAGAENYVKLRDFCTIGLFEDQPVEITMDSAHTLLTGASCNQAFKSGGFYIAEDCLPNARFVVDFIFKCVQIAGVKEFSWFTNAVFVSAVSDVFQSFGSYGIQANDRRRNAYARGWLDCLPNRLHTYARNGRILSGSRTKAAYIEMIEFAYNYNKGNVNKIFIQAQIQQTRYHG